ncbi:MAG: DUF692 domain-containing protein [Alphaproteobacteria bacterium]|nr:DUF692 domain-containing protein [Alphaproteobacteria bacterium]
MFGLGLRHPHHQYVLQHHPQVDFFEVHTENFIAEGGASLNFLSQVAERYPLSFHCVGLSLGSAAGLNQQHMRNIKKLLDLYQPFLFSDHLSWSNSSSAGTSNDLLPIPYNQESLKIFCDNVSRAQDFFGREILIENPSAYLQFKGSQIFEVDFLNEITRKTDCGILLDINNVFVSSQNFSFDPKEYLNRIEVAKVKEIHLAGHSIYNGLRIDTHSTHICKEVMELYGNFVQQHGKKIPTLIEWDEDIPEFSMLFNEMKKVQRAAQRVTK